MPRKQKQNDALTPVQMAAAIATIGGTGLFAAAVAADHGGTVSVSAPRYGLNDTVHNVAASNGGYQNDRTEYRGGNIMKRMADNVEDSDKDLDTVIINMVNRAIRASDVVFTPAGRNLTYHNIRAFTMLPENKRLLERSNGEYIKLEDNINQTVKTFAVTEGICKYGANAGRPVVMHVTPAYIGSLIDAAIQRSDVTFSPDGIKFAHHLIQTHIKQPLYHHLGRDSCFDIIGLETFINNEVSDMSKHKSIYGRSRSNTQ